MRRQGDALLGETSVPQQSRLRLLAPSLAVAHPAETCLLVSKRTASARQDEGGAMPSLNHSARVCGVTCALHNILIFIKSALLFLVGLAWQGRRARGARDPQFSKPSWASENITSNPPIRAALEPVIFM
jgi:hypothetical protein